MQPSAMPDSELVRLVSDAYDVGTRLRAGDDQDLAGRFEKERRALVDDRSVRRTEAEIKTGLAELLNSIGA